MSILTRRFAASIFRQPLYWTDPWACSLRFSFLISCRFSPSPALDFFWRDMPESTWKMLARVVFHSLLPCLAFRLLVTSSVSGQNVARQMLLAVLIMGAMGLVGYSPRRGWA